jgi:hypothetical protein
VAAKEDEMFYLFFESPVPTPGSVKIVEGERSGAYYDGPYASRREAIEAKDEAIDQRLLEWSQRDDPDGGSPFWRFPPSGGECPPPEWAAQYGFEFYAANEAARYWSVRLQ